MKFKNAAYACALAMMAGLGMGFSATTTADPGCAGDCFAARYECYAQCGNSSQCKAYCQSAYQDCLAACE